VSVTVTPLAWDEVPIGGIDLPAKRLEMVWGFGSGLTRRRGDGTIWGIGDRGPNLKVEVALAEYGLTAVESHAEVEGAKVMPRVDIGPALAELRVAGDRVELLRIVPLHAGGAALSGLPPPGSEHARLEPVVDLDGRVIAPDPSGADSEGVVALADGFVVGDEYGPSLLRLNADGQVVERWVPEGTGAGYAGARYRVREVLPAIAATRRLNRGFEAVAPAADGGLVLAFQSPLSNPAPKTSKRADHLRVWRLDGGGRFEREWLYPLEPADRFRRDPGAKPGKRKVSEISWLGGDRYLVLERVSRSTKFFVVELSGGAAAPDTGEPTLEERSAAGEPLPALTKTLVLDTDDHPEIGADLEGATLLSPTELLLVNDNDFGVEGAVTGFWRVRFDAPL
jgi:hypothetical protein